MKTLPSLACLIFLVAPIGNSSASTPSNFPYPSAPPMPPSRAGPTAAWSPPARPQNGTTNSAPCLRAWTRSGSTTADPRYFNYIKNSVDALVAPDGSIPTLKPEDHRARQHPARPPASASLPRHAEQALSHRRHLSLSTSSRSSRATPEAASGTSSAIPTRCGSTASTWPSLFAPNTLPSRIIPKTSTTSPISSSSWSSTRAIPRPACSTTAGMNRSRSAGPTSKPATPRNSGRAASAGT